MSERDVPLKPSADQLDAMATEVLTRTGYERLYRQLREEARVARQTTQGETTVTPIQSLEGPILLSPWTTKFSNFPL